MSSKFHARRFEDKVAIVTAATDGIGLAIAERLAHEGARVVISSRTAANVERAVAHIVLGGIDAANVHGCVCHVAHADDRQRLVDATLTRFGRVDVLVNNAGINPFAGDILDVTESVWDKLFDVNVKAGLLLTQLVVPHMAKMGGGSIVFNASIAAYLTPHPIAPYSITKTTLLALTRALSASLAAKNIRVNCISPGVIKTRMSEKMWKKDDSTPELTKIDGVGVNPMRRYGIPAECAGAVAFLASADASYITGENIVIAGGEYSRL